jgi:glycosyltransferase involved in cell wall biosynthesis
LALVEAMARGIPAISTQTGGIVELLEGGAGLLVPPGDPEALADAIETLSCDPNLHARMQASGRKRVVDQFGVESTVGELAARMAGTFSGFADRLSTENQDRSASLSITWPANS